jgi:hypothetical protein
MQRGVPSEVNRHAGNISAVSFVENYALREPLAHFAKLSSTKICLVHSCSTFQIFTREAIRKLLTEDLDMRKVSAKIVPNEFTEEQKNKGSSPRLVFDHK